MSANFYPGMHVHRIVIIWLFMFPFFAQGLELTLVASSHCPYSSLSRLPAHHLLYIGKRSRFSTCTAVAWFPDQKHLISAHLIDGTMQTFEFDEQRASLRPLEFFSPFLGTQLIKPEHLAFSPDGHLIAIANGHGGALNFYAVDSCTLNPIPVAILKESDKTKFHSVRFSPDGQFLAYATFDNCSHISIVKIHREGKLLSFSLSHTLPNSLDPLKPKGVSFSPDQRFIAVCYSRRAIRIPNNNLHSAVEIYAFDSLCGTIDPKPLSRIEAHLCVPEDLLFDPLQPYLFVSNQGNDTITVHAFDPQSGTLHHSLHTCLKNPEAALSFPHGISITKDGKYLASSNYGDDKITVYKIQRDD